jgi:hypothetical protein
MQIVNLRDVTSTFPETQQKRGGELPALESARREDERRMRPFHELNNPDGGSR